MKRSTVTVATVLAALLSAAPAASANPVAVPIVQTVPDAADTPWPGGTILLDIDATDVDRGAFRVVQTFPVAPGTQRVTLLFPQWLPGNHGPRGPLSELADLRLEADGKPVRWTRDPVEVFAFHVDLPESARQLVARFVHTSPLRTAEGRVVMTREMLNLQWEKMSLYPAGHYVRQIRIKPTVTFPAGWQDAAALDGRSASGNRVSWAETDYETLVDSPIFAGQHMRRWDLGNRVMMNVVADSPEQLAARAEDMASFNALVQESLLLFGRPPFDRYEFLVALTERMGGIGLEHLRSSENQLEPKNLIDWKTFDWDRNVISHELVHAWNGKYRRPDKLWTPDYRQPMQDNLLWLYEGQTQFWGMVLAARSGTQTKETVLGMLAGQAGKYAEQPGRGWRSVEDTTHDPVFAARRPKPFASLHRDEDYYNEGALIWLEADQIIRTGTGGRRGLDDFALRFFAHSGKGERARTYDFAEIAATLNAVHPHDWKGFLESRLQEAGRPAPLAGIERAGYRLVWKDEANPYDKGRMAESKRLELLHSIGLNLGADGEVVATQWDGPAFRAGIVNGAKIVAVNGEAYSSDRIKAAISQAKGGDKPIDLLVRRGDRFTSVPVQWHGGLRWPWLERADGGKSPGGLDRLLAPRRPVATKRD